MAVIEVDGKQLEVKDGIMLIEATDNAGIHIPRFCYHKKLSIAANCRMCLVEVEKAPKPLPACATPVSDGMKVFTQSQQAREAQKSTLEFLLINHPLDCPICDQGGECPLQDQAIGYGSGSSRYHEEKRTVPNNNIGPLIATAMTRCIHCTRCVRFGEEIAGTMEMGALGRGEHTQINTFLSRPINSEISANIIDLCPVGALTAKPSRFTARPWELQSHASISPHDCLGTNTNIQTLRNQVKRILPRDNEAINQCWLADRDRYSYQAVNSDQRLLTPMIRVAGKWQETDWESALKHAVAGLNTIIDTSNPQQIGALAGVSCMLEEFYLLQKLMRALGSENIDHRLQQGDFRDDDIAPISPMIERPITAFDTTKAVLLVGSNQRKEQPLLALRLRHAVNQGASISAINSLDYDFNFSLNERLIVPPHQLTHYLAQLAAQIATRQNIPLPAEIKHWCMHGDVDHNNLNNIADTLIKAGEDGMIVLGAGSLLNADGSVLRAISEWICQSTAVALMPMSPANSIAAHIAGCLPHRGPHGKIRHNSGLHNQAMFTQGLRGFLLFGCEPVLDSIDSRAALAALQKADFVIQVSAFKSDQSMDYADVLLPLAAFAENAGTYINCEGQVQTVTAATTPRGTARPGWKILRVLGNFFALDGFEQVQISTITAELELNSDKSSSRLTSWWLTQKSAFVKTQWQRIVEMPMYRGDDTLRHSTALQATEDNPAPWIRMNPTSLNSLGLTDGCKAIACSETDRVELTVKSDLRVPDHCVLIIAGHCATVPLGGQGPITVEAL